MGERAGHGRGFSRVPGNPATQRTIPESGLPRFAPQHLGNVIFRLALQGLVQLRAVLFVAAAWNSRCHRLPRCLDRRRGESTVRNCGLTVDDALLQLPPSSVLLLWLALHFIDLASH